MRRALLDGRIAPGAVLREAELAETLRISRGSVRDGLTQLEREGLVVTGWHRPSRVIPITPRDARELYGLRAALDRVAAENAAKNTDQSLITKAVDSLGAIDASASEPHHLIELDLQFHDAIYLTADSSRLLQAWRTIRTQVQFFQTRRVASNTHDYRARVAREHRELADLIAHGPSPELDRHVLDHVDQGLRALLSALPSGDTSSQPARQVTGVGL